MFEGMTDPARSAVVRAAGRARELGQRRIGSEHLLWGSGRARTHPLPPGRSTHRRRRGPRRPRHSVGPRLQRDDEPADGDVLPLSARESKHYRPHRLSLMPTVRPASLLDTCWRRCWWIGRVAPRHCWPGSELIWTAAPGGGPTPTTTRDLETTAKLDPVDPVWWQMRGVVARASGPARVPRPPCAARFELVRRRTLRGWWCALGS